MTKQTFNPEEYLIKLKGNDYLEVKWRIYWFREIHPNGNIKTELLEHVPDGHALVRATITKHNENHLPDGSAVAHKMVTAKKNPNYVEVAETGAIGRALGLLGFGTEFSGTDYSSAEEGSIPDSERIRAEQTRTLPPTPIREPEVDTETGEILADDDEPILDDPNEIIIDEIADDMKAFAVEWITAGVVTQQEVTNEIVAINERKSKIAELTNHEAGIFEQWLHGVLEERGAGN